MFLVPDQSAGPLAISRERRRAENKAAIVDGKLSFWKGHFSVPGTMGIGYVKTDDVLPPVNLFPSCHPIVK
ncbi:hypothetical protein CEXT_260681 [Caerostris extrusa]|uniref:Uncharacterized protein n=1 Tax=Caerostris extrusa TaxID=172846 RepID=A0AAV4SMJ3_CAEEX|nr:hypothetical protein CEXT_260681 [Caerostris extrusa]